MVFDPQYVYIASSVCTVVLQLSFPELASRSTVAGPFLFGYYAMSMIGSNLVLGDTHHISVCLV